MTTAVLAARRNQNLYRQPTRLQLGPNAATFVVVAVVSVLALLYLNQITKTSVFNYRLSGLQTQETQLLTQKQDLAVEAARLQSIHTVQTNPAVAGMVPTTAAQVTYATK